MEEFVTSGSDSLSFRTIVLQHLNGILSLTARGGEGHVRIYGRMVKGLSDVLLPFYDDTMTSDYKTYEDNLKTTNTTNSVKMLDLYRNLFRSLNQLLNRNDYLQSSIYSEEDED